MQSIDSELLEILACPKCKARVKEGDAAIICANPLCALAYPVRDGIPVMLIEEAVASENDSKKFGSPDKS